MPETLNTGGGQKRSGYVQSYVVRWYVYSIYILYGACTYKYVHVVRWYVHCNVLMIIYVYELVHAWYARLKA